MDNELTLYEALGGEAGIRRLVSRFYHHMRSMPEAADVRALHSEDLSRAEEKLFLFLSGWTGGPRLFTERYGHPMLRSRHLPFAIGKRERDQWMLCMLHALEDVGVRSPMREFLLDALLRLADHMRNRQEEL